MMRRTLSGIFPLLLALIGPCAASSLSARPVPSAAESPSIVTRGEPAARAVEALPLERMEAQAEIYSIGSSVIAFGADAIPVAGEPVASIGDTPDSDKPRWASDATPLVIRGGMIGDAFSAPPAPDVNPPQAHAPSSGVSTPQTAAPEASPPSDPATPSSPLMTPR